MTIHVVTVGETVDSIAAAYGVDPFRLAADNEVGASGALAVGQTLVVRFPELVHAVRPGDTLTSIAAEYGLSVRKLYQNNWSLGGLPALEEGVELVISYQDPPTGSAVFNGYAYPFTDTLLLDAQTPYLTYLTPFTYGITAEGGLLPLNDDALLLSARTHGARPVLHLSSYTEEDRFDSERATLVLTDEAAQDRLISDVEALLREKGLAVPYADFLARLRRVFGAQGYFVWAALSPKTSSNQPGLLYEAHDYAAISASVDAVLLMTYEWGYTYGPPMAVSPLPQVRAVLDYAVTQIPPEKIFLGLSNYGYDWTLPFVTGESKAQSISNQRAIELAIQYDVAIEYDETAQAPFCHYTDQNGAVHEVWFDDARSLSARLLLIREYGFQGAGIWNVSRPFSQLYLVMASLYDLP
ncbi:Spore germination protein YaaH [bioreactor metagenome]|uniref:Spore germination protein YaaH n=1 Tax=bioreactor metagenome TaxID=1076179 RepID=A0A645B2U4_9ZZZZ